MLMEVCRDPSCGLKCLQQCHNILIQNTICKHVHLIGGGEEQNREEGEIGGGGKVGRREKKKRNRLGRNWLKKVGRREKLQGSIFEKKPWGQLAPKFLDLVASTNFLVAKNFPPFGPKTVTSNCRSTNCQHHLLFSAREK